MNSTKIIQSNNTAIELFEFHGRSDANEWYAYIHATDATKSFKTQIDDMIKAIWSLLAQNMAGATCVMARCHVSDAANQRQYIMEKLANLRCMVSIVQQPPLDGTKAAIMLYAVGNIEKENETANGVNFTHNNYQHYWSTEYGNVADKTYFQTVGLLNNCIANLQNGGMTLADNCMRTWLYVNDIDNNYADVVYARNDVFNRENLTDRTHFITSTGIAGSTGIMGVNVMLDTYSINGLQTEQTQYLYGTTHMNRTSEYGVRFERGTAIKYGDRTHAFISGTASIDCKGEILYPNDIRRQTERMWENIDVLLKEVDMRLDDNAAVMTVYLRDMADYQIVNAIFAKRFPECPKTIVLAPVCRQGWLIEMECICIKDANNEYPEF